MNFSSAEVGGSNAVIQKRAELEAELVNIEKQIETQNTIIQEKQRESTTLERDIAIFESKIEKARLEIKARDLAIKKLGNSIKEKEGIIGALSVKIDKGKESLSELLRRTNEIDSTSLIEVILGYEDMSDFFNDLDTFGFIEEAVQELFNELRNDVARTHTEKEELLTARTEQYELKDVQELQEKKNRQYKKDKEQILKITKGEEKKYQEILKEKQKSAAEIKTALFALRDSAAIPFGDAYDYAKQASFKTGVRPALVLAILTQETNLGENVGQCLLTNSPNKGDGKGKNTGRYFAGVMKPTRDVDPFMEIASELGFDPYGMAVSCPPSYGYGGAMGPSQFIPSTWILYKDKLAEITGQNPANPWDPRTAIFATALLMRDNGASEGTAYTERRAALRYFAGWGNAGKSSYSFYGDAVMEFANKYQEWIDALN